MLLALIPYPQNSEEFACDSCLVLEKAQLCWLCVRVWRSVERAYGSSPSPPVVSADGGVGGQDVLVLVDDC